MRQGGAGGLESQGEEEGEEMGKDKGKDKGEDKGEDKVKDKCEEMAAKIGKKPYVTQSGRRVKRAAKMEESWGREVARRYLAPF